MFWRVAVCAAWFGGPFLCPQKLEAMTEFVETMSVWEFDLLPAFPSDWELKKWYSGCAARWGGGCIVLSGNLFAINFVFEYPARYNMNSNHHMFRGGSVVRYVFE